MLKIDHDLALELMMISYTVEPPIMDYLYYGILHNVDIRLQSRIISYSLLCIATSVQWKPPYSEFGTLKSHPDGQNQYKFCPESRQSCLTSVSVEKYLLRLQPFIYGVPFVSKLNFDIVC